jgi:hypothetical protein
MLAPYEPSRVGEARAIAFKICVEPEDEPERAIALVRSLPDTFRIGRVLSIGSAALEAIPELAVGDRVLYAQSVACTTAMARRHFVHHDHVVCIVEPGATQAELDPRPVSAPARAHIEAAAPAWSGNAGKFAR